jgi:sodium/bile acid cotransporter 7
VDPRPDMKQDIQEKTTAVHDEEAISTPQDVASISSQVVEEPAVPAQEAPKPVFRRIIDSIVWFLRDQWFLVALAALIIIASQHQIPEKRQKQKASIVTYLCVSVIFFVTGCTLSTQTLIKNYARWKLHLFVQVQCFLMSSAIVFAVVSAAASNRDFMDPGLLIGMVFMGCVATTISSNVVMTRQAHGNQALTVVQSTLGNLLGPFLTPALLHMYFAGNSWYSQVLPAENSNFKEIYRRVFKQLGLSVFLPLVSLPIL